MASSINRIIGSLYEKHKAPSHVAGENLGQEKAVETKNISINKARPNIFRTVWIRTKEFFRNNQTNIKYLLYAIPIIAIFLIARAVQNNQSLKSKAGTYSANVLFQLSNSSLPPESTFQVWFNTSAPVAFASTEINFDPTLVKMTKEVTLTSTVLIRTIKVTPMAEANTTGKIYIILGLDPTKLTTSPTGAFQIADITFNALTTGSNVSTALTFNTNGMQVVSTDQTLFSLSSNNLTLTLNPTATPSPVPSTTSTPAPSLTPKPTQSATCSKCFKKQCNAVCEKGDSKTLCPDCL